MSEQDIGDSGSKVINGCLLFLMFLSLLVVGSCLFVYKNKDSLLESATKGVEKMAKNLENVIDMPYYGEQEYIQSVHGVFINELTAAAQASTSLFTFAATVEEMQKPDELIYFAIIRGKDTMDVIKTLQWSGRSTIVMNGYGAARFSSDGNDIKVMIYENSGPWPYMDEFKAYFLHDVGEPVPDTDSLSY